MTMLILLVILDNIYILESHSVECNSSLNHRAVEACQRQPLLQVQRL